MSYDFAADMAQIHADELSKAEFPFIILIVVVAIVLVSVMLVRKNGEKNLLENLWEGNIGLAMAYWVYGVLGGIIWSIGIFAINPAPDGNLVKIIWFIFACYYFVVYVGVWKAANKFVGNKVWAILAKFAVIIVVLPAAIHFLKWFSAE
jgi:hypothetical protein